jgi:glucose/arabinose dehydrogenase
MQRRSVLSGLFSRAGRRHSSESVRAAKQEARAATPQARQVIARACQHIEPLEDRTLYAATLQPGFSYTTAYNIPAVECTSMAFAPGGRLFYAQKTGELRVIVNGTLQSGYVLKVQADGYAERGFDGFTVDPNFATNGFIYCYYTRPDPAKPNQPDSNAKNRLSKFKVNLATNKLDTTYGEHILLDNIASPTGFHNGGGLHFGPDGKLYVSVGEGGPPTPTGVSPASDLSNLNGKMLRINSDGSAPSDNPYFGQAGKRPEIWAWGLRNPFTFNISASGKIYENDVGSSKYEEVNNIVKAGNYGWPSDGEGPNANAKGIQPIYYYSHNGGQAAITGGTFISGNNFPANLQGKYFFTDYVNHWLRVIDPATNQIMTFNGSQNFGSNLNGILDLDIGPDGALYGLAPYSGKIVRIGWTGSTTSNRPPDAEATADKTGGPLPLTVNFDGSASSDPDGNALSYSWNFGDGSTGTGVSPSHAYTVAGTYNAVLTVNDGHGATASTAPIKIVAGDAAPDVNITSPLATDTYEGNQTIQFAATATDDEDGVEPASAFHWEIKLHHLDHEHPFLAFDGVKTGQFTIPTDAEPDSRQNYRLYLTVTDSAGQSVTTMRQIEPHLSTWSLRSNIPGISINVDGIPTTTPADITGVVNTNRQLNAPATQIVAGKTYTFVGWSDGGAAIHEIAIPSADTTYTATYQLTTATGPAVTSLSLINADTDKVLSTLADNATINLNTTPHINIAANTSGTIGSIVFTLNGTKVRTENTAPYSIGGDTGVGLYNVWNVAPGTYTLTVTPFSAANGTGTAGTSITRHFTVTKTTTTVKAGLNATYFDNANFTGATVSRIDANINFGWGVGSPATGIGVDTFSARWTGKIKAATTGTYTFTALSDNGARVWINGKLVIDDWVAHAPHEKSGTIALTAGVKYDIKVEYFDNTEGATMKLYWATSSMAKTIVPGTAFTTA